MSRFIIELHYDGQIDSSAAIGYDRPLRSFFLQGFINSEEDNSRPELWLGAFLEEYPTLEALSDEVKSRGYVFRNLTSSAIVTMLAEAGQKPKPSVGERIGIAQ